MGARKRSDLLQELSILKQRASELERKLEGLPAEEPEAQAEAEGAPRGPLLAIDTFQLLVAPVEDYAIFLLDASGRVRSWNQGAELIKGYRAEQILGRHFSLFYPEEDIAAGKPLWELDQAELRGKLEDTGWRVREDGSRFYANVIITALRDERGQLAGFIKVTRDITARREAEVWQQQLFEPLRKAAVEWRRTFDAVELPIVVLDGQGRILRLNQAAQVLSGRSLEALQGQTLELMGPRMPWAQASALVAEMLQTQEAGSTQVYDTRTQLAWELSVHPDGGTEGARFILVMKDISRMMVLQDLLRQSKALSLLGEMMAGVAHEVRNPLFGISSTLDALEARLKGEGAYARHLAVLRQEVQRLTVMMNDLLAYGRPSGTQRQAQDLEPVLEEAVRACAELARTRGVQVRLSCAPGLPQVRMEPGRLTQVFQNLLSNALYHAPPGSTVTLSAELRGPWLECVVIDEGPGFQVDDLPRLFEPFFSRREGGVGLGLPIVQRIVEQHEGRVCAGNGPTGGARVVVRLPRVRDGER